jgi:hypothetical protein
MTEITHFVCEIEPNVLITHDGFVQLGIFHHSLEDHLRLNSGTEWQVTYWTPDPLGTRYKRINFQHTMRANENSPKTDNATDNRPRDFPDQPTTRLDRPL